MKKYVFVLFLVFCAGLVTAQVKNAPGKKAMAYKFVKAIKMNGFNYQIYTKDIKEEVIEDKIPVKDPNAPQVVTELKKMIDYDRDDTGVEYVLYSVNSKGKKQLELTFPKQIRNADNKIINEGTYQITGKNLTIVFNRFDYHFPTTMTTVYRFNNYRSLSFIKRDEVFLNTDGFTDDYIKRAKDNVIKSNE